MLAVLRILGVSTVGIFLGVLAWTRSIARAYRAAYWFNPLEVWARRSSS